MFKRILVSIGFLIIAGAASGFAQSPLHRIEASAYAGWSFSDGVSGTPVTAGDGRVYDRVDPKDGGIFGFSVGAHINDQAEAGFMYSRQASELVFGGAPATGSADRQFGDLKISTYHGYFGFNFRAPEEQVRPFLYGGLGATNFGGVDFSVPGRSGTIAGNTQFSTTWGVGVKIFPSPKVGVRLASSWTPTYIKSDAAGWWCDPYWGCYLAGNSQYANQLHLTGGVSFRF